MDHIDDILSSDLLERYVLGTVSEDERMKVDLLRLEHRAIRDELDRLEKTMEQAALENAVAPPKGTRECIIKNIASGDSVRSNISNSSAKTTGGWWKMAAALVLGALGSWMIMQQQVNDTKTMISDQEERLAILERDCNKLTEQYAFINHTNTLPFVLEGGSKSTPHQVIVYWNEAIQKSMLRVVDLPAIQGDETFQLWADVDGQMLSLGVFDPGQAIADAIPMNYLDDATSLNITIEPQGGSEHPDVSRLTASVAI